MEVEDDEGVNDMGMGMGVHRDAASNGGGLRTEGGNEGMGKGDEDAAAVTMSGEAFWISKELGASKPIEVSYI